MNPIPLRVFLQGQFLILRGVFQSMTLSYRVTDVIGIYGSDSQVNFNLLPQFR